MGNEGGLGPKIVIWFDRGPLAGFYITETVFWAVIVAAAICVLCLVSVRKLKQNPKGLQGFAELYVETVYKYTKDNMGPHNMSFAPFIGTIFIFLLISNALGLIGFRPVTSDMNATFALTIMIFFIIQISSMRSAGIGHYLGHFAQPYPFMIPIKIMEEFTFPLSLSFRLFGNILAGVIIMELAMEGLAHLSHSLKLAIPLFQIGIPLPLNAFFDMFEPVLQAFVFSMLTMAFIAKGIVVHDEGYYAAKAEKKAKKESRKAKKER
jgi:F-type H+-transporting ATPase subunit a